MRVKQDSSTLTATDLEWTASFLLTSVAVIASAMAAWSFGTELGWAQEFPFETGAMAHWQPWAIMAGLGEAGSLFLQSVASA